MFEVRRTTDFATWLDRLEDARARVRVLARLDRIGLGNFGDYRAVGESVSEFRIDYGPGYRIYFTKRQATIVFLLIGGTKSTQDRDIKKAHALARNLDE
ncbi:MAG: type II toxin-antitoxin system RelE/ParE family toxin [Gammaproteobacteria bacterium]